MKDVMDILMKFRNDVRVNAKDPKQIFTLADQLRDDVLPEIGIELVDLSKEESKWRFEGKEKLYAEK